uniref:Uncharacterized protein n=1 Tax=Tetraodon nigroviridis TaxID=99883 RepID=H3DCX2_TETNG
MSNGYRTLSQHLNDLKKENFSLKLRIYFLEERIQQKYEESSEDVYRTNIELKVEVESLKQELQEKQQLLDKALTTAESVTNHNEAELQRRCQERQLEIDHMQQVLETKIQLLQEEAQLARSEAERMASLAGSQSQPSLLSFSNMMEDIQDEEKPPRSLSPTSSNKDRLIEELTKKLQDKEALITELSGEKTTLTLKVGELEVQVQELHSSLLQKDKGLVSARLSIASQCVNELQKAQLQVQSLQAKIQESEANNMKLQEKLNEMERELRSIRQAAQSQERTIQGLTESNSTKDREVQELYQLIEGQNTTLCKLREMAHRNQLAQCKAPEGVSESVALAQLQSELVGVQSSLFSLGLELEASQRRLRQSQRQGDDLIRLKDRLISDLQEVLQHREVTEKHNQDLRCALQKCRSELQDKEAALKESEAERCAVVQEKDRSITQLRHCLQDKEQQLQEYAEILESTSSSKPRDALLEKLRERIKDRDRALERSIDEKYHCVEELEGQVRRLQLALREKERDLERLRCILSSNEETITSLEALVRGKELELEQAAEAYRNLQWLKQQTEGKERNALREKDIIISQLQSALQSQSQETQDLTADLVTRVQAGPTEVVEELKARLALKEKLFQELLSDRTRQSNEHQVLVQDMLNTLSSKDQYLQDYSYRLSVVISEQSSQMQELRKQLSVSEEELHQLKRTLERTMGTETDCLTDQNTSSHSHTPVLAHQELMRAQEESTLPSSKDSEAELKALQEELQLLLKKEREAQMIMCISVKQKELSVLRSSLGNHQLMDSAESSGHQVGDGCFFPSVSLGRRVCSLLCVLKQLVVEYNQLNEALRTEKKLYQNLVQFQTRSDCPEKIQSLHTELDSVQALRAQLEDVLGRARGMALELERAAKRQHDYGGGDGQSPASGFVGDLPKNPHHHFYCGNSYESVSCLFQVSFVTKETRHHKPQIPPPPFPRDQPSIIPCRIIPQPHEMRKHLHMKRVNDCTQHQTLAAALCDITFPFWSHDHRRTGKDEVECLEERDEMMASGYNIEEEDYKVTARNLASEAVRDAPQRSDGKEFDGAKKTLAGKLEGADLQPEEGGFTPVVQMRSGLQRLPLENRALRERRARAGAVALRANAEKNLILSSSVTDLFNAAQELEPAAGVSEEGEIWQDTEEELREQAARLSSNLALSHQENRELQERLMVSEATVHAQAEQLKDYRELLTETSVQQASKQVQVDLQDLGYECGRSENEAEREDTSSPDFDDLEMCTSLSLQRDYKADGGSWCAGDGGGESAHLHRLVEDLRSQLTRCHKVIRGLQMRVRSLSATSDYASSLERTPRKVNWAFETSPAPSGVEDDEGWVSDTQGVRSASKPSRELQELMERVASLEAQQKSSKLEGKAQTEESKCATWPGKYNSLIQTQARELSHLRQRMREGQRVCHILTQNMGDTTKAFEELLRANDIDYYMGQSLREQLAQNIALAQRVSPRSADVGDYAESHGDKTDHELLALRLSKELQHKDKIIESLHTKLNQRPETPSSCQALSETTDPSDRTSPVSDECKTNEDLELCSDLDSREYQEERRLQQPGSGSERDVRPSVPSVRPSILKSSSSCPNMLCSAAVGLSQSRGTPLTAGFERSAFFHERVSSSFLSAPSGPDLWGTEVASDPRPRALSVIAVRPELDTLYKKMNEQNRGAQSLSNYSQLSHHAFQQYQLSGIPEGHSTPSDLGLIPGGPLWDLDNTAHSVGSYCGSGHQQGCSQTGVNLIEEHLREVRCLRQRLEESIRTNERLRQQLEERLATTGRDGGAPTNIYIQGLDTVTQLSNELRVLKEENLCLQSRLQASSATDKCEEMMQLHEAAFTARARLKQAELEAEQWKEELRRLQTHSQEQGQQIHTLRQERQTSQEKTNRLQHEVSLLQQQLCESRELIHSLQSELQVYDRMCSSMKANKGYLCNLTGLPVELAELLGEVRSLRAQLQNSVQENTALKQLELHKQLEQRLGVGSPRAPFLSALTASPQRENFYRRQLLHDPAPSPPVRDIGLFNCGSPGPPYSDVDDNHSTANGSAADTLDPHSELEGEAPDGSFANRNGRHAIGHVDDFSALQQQVLEGRNLVQRMETTLHTCLSPPLLEGNQRRSEELVLGCVKSLLSNTKTLKQILEEAMSLLKMFWRAALPSTDPAIQNLKKEQCMQEEILSLKLRISEQEEVLKGTVQRLRSTSRTKESMEHFIVNQLSRTRDVLKKARTNLEVSQAAGLVLPPQL